MQDSDSIIKSLGSYRSTFLSTVFVVAIFLFLKLIAYMFTQSNADNTSISISLTSISLWLLILALGGFGFGYLALRSYGRWNDLQAKLVCGWVLAIFFGTNICFGGGCFAAGLLITIYYSIALLPVVIGAKLARLLFEK